MLGETQTVDDELHATLSLLYIRIIKSVEQKHPKNPDSQLSFSKTNGDLKRDSMLQQYTAGMCCDNMLALSQCTHVLPKNTKKNEPS